MTDEGDRVMQISGAPTREGGEEISGTQSLGTGVAVERMPPRNQIPLEPRRDRGK